jgi:membrane-bound lytic murein transglycosylase D
MRSIPFENFLYDYFSKKNLPRELLAIPFLESSFNPVAQSKVNALGAWQFMPFISKHFVPKRRDNIDYRRSIGVSSISAAFLMEQNFKILKSWDLAVTAYNSGTKNILNTKKNLKKDRISLVDIIENGKSKSFGFASKNFYSEFLALVHTLAYRDEIFLIPNFESELLENDLHFFISKCDAKLSHILKPYELEEIDSYNHHFYDFHKILHKGLIISSKLNLSKKYFFKLSNEQILKFKPIEWPKLVRNYNCSTK